MKIIPAMSLALIFFCSFLLSKASGELSETVLKVPLKYRSGVFAEVRRLYAPPGFSVSVFSAGLQGARFMATDETGVIYLSVPSEGVVMAMPDRDRDGVADKEIVFASGLDRPHGLAFMDGELVVAETGRLIGLKDMDKDLKADIKRVITDDLPSGGGHWTKTVVIGPDRGPDKALYVSGGSTCNACVEKDKRRAAVLRFTDPRAEVYATGLRNSVGMEFHPFTKELWGVDNGRDLLGDDIPPEELNMIKRGGDYGWPYCYGKRVPDPELGDRKRCATTIPPVVEMQAHSAPLGLAFGYGVKFPREYSDVLYIAFHGSWNRTIPTGYKVVSVPFKDGAPSGGPADFLAGFLIGERAWGRPVDVMVGIDGALYISDDSAGAVYRVTGPR